MEERRSFYRNYPVIKFTKGETVFFQDETPKCIYIVKTGIVEIANSTSTGDSQSISFETVGDIIPKCWAFSKTTKTLFSYKAFTDCELYIIDKTNFIAQLTDNHEFANKVLGRAVSSLVGTRLHVEALEKPSANIKLLYMFRYFCLQYGEKVSENTVNIKLPLSQQDIADFSGLTRETTSKEIGILKNNKILVHKRKYYTIDIDKLNEAIDDEYNPGVSVSLLH